MCFKTRCKISKYEINIIPTYGMKVKIINRYGVFLTINKNEKKKLVMRVWALAFWSCKTVRV